MPRATLSQIEIVAPDPERAAAFFLKVFGWSAMTVPWDGPTYVRMFPPEPGEPVGAGILAPDASGILDRVREAGGRVALEPIPIGASGLYARFFDPDANSFGLWQDLAADAPESGG